MSAAEADQLFRRLDREIWLVTARDGDCRGGLIATAVMSASIVPTAPRVVIAIAKQHATWELIEASSAFTLQLLPPDALPILECFGMHTSRDVDKFVGFDWDESLPGGPLWRSSLGWLDCRVEARFDTGDRTLYLAEIVAARSPGAADSILTVGRMVQRLPADRLSKLRDQLHADAAIDLTAIAAWRRTQQH